MKISFQFNSKSPMTEGTIIISAFQKTEGKKTKLINTHWTKEIKEAFRGIQDSDSFEGDAGSSMAFHTAEGQSVIVFGLGEKKNLSLECVRRFAASLFAATGKKHKKLTLQIDGFVAKSKFEDSLEAFLEGFGMSNYEFDRHKAVKRNLKLEDIVIETKEKATKKKKAEAILKSSEMVTNAIHTARDYVNEAPNILNSEYYAKAVEKDVKGIKGVKVKILGRPEMKKEKMDLFLSVNNGSAHQPRLVHLTYTPAKFNSKTKHVCLVGKGLTFDTGGYSLKPGGSMVNMKFDMAGSATVYGAFKAAARMGANVKITCILGMTDNNISPGATTPDSIVRARNGKTVEILNTDAEGRLVLADCLDYACDLKPTSIIDSATLTGACLVSLGTEICGIMGNDQKLVDSLLKSAKAKDEYMWQLPIIKEFRDDMKSPIADLKNIGGSRFGGTSKAAAFLENFIKNDISWAHLDIAGVGDSQSHLPYCPKKGASGLMIRSLVHYMMNEK